MQWFLTKYLFVSLNNFPATRRKINLNFFLLGSYLNVFFLNSQEIFEHGTV
jgi:hypothetical protein